MIKKSKNTSTLKVTPYTVVQERTASSGQKAWIKNQLLTLVLKNNFTAKDLEKYENRSKIRQSIRRLAQNDSDTMNRCMPDENLRNQLLEEILLGYSNQKVG